MKLNLDNFIRSCDAKINAFHFIQDGEEMVRTRSGDFIFHSRSYHTVKWWSVFNRNGGLEMLIYLENPRKKYDWNEWSRRRKFFCEIREILEKGE